MGSQLAKNAPVTANWIASYTLSPDWFKYKDFNRNVAEIQQPHQSMTMPLDTRPFRRLLSRFAVAQRRRLIASLLAGPRGSDKLLAGPALCDYTTIRALSK